jgi:hypothetical protein
VKRRVGSEDEAAVTTAAQQPNPFPMEWAMSRALLILLAASGLMLSLAGCNTDPLFAEDKVRMGPICMTGPVVEGEPIELDPTASERELVENVVCDRARYHEALVRLHACYREKGNHIKLRWVDRELAGLQRIEEPNRPRAVQLASRGQEVDLVEDLVTARKAYHRSLGELRRTYQAMGNPTKLRWVDLEVEDASKIQAFQYLTDAEIPGPWLRPTESIPAADILFEKAYARMKEGGHGVPAFYREEIMVDALEMMKRLIHHYPTSDKIDDAAFYCGEIHKEYLKDQHEIAVQWYERAWTWDPHTPHAARFQAAVVYDYRMHDRARALELYHDVLKHETSDWTNVAFAKERIRQLTAELAAAEPRYSE